MDLRVKRGRSRVVGPSSVSLVRGGRVVIVDGADSGDDSVGGVVSGLMSVVTGGLVLVIVAVVVAGEVVPLRSVTENVGSTNSVGAGSGSPA